MSYIDRIKVGSTTHLIEPTLYAECKTAAGTTTKQTATIDNFTLVAGAQVAVKFTITNTAAVSDLKLQIGTDTTTAKSIKYRGENLPAKSTLTANHIYNFIYDGTNWELVGDLDTNTQSAYGNISTSGTLGTASQAVVTDSNKKITTADLSVSDDTTIGTTTTSFVAKVTQSAQGKITVTKANLPTASTSVAGITKVGASGGAAAYNHNHDTIYSAIHQTTWNWASDGTEPLSKYVTFDANIAAGNTEKAPDAGWYNGFVTSHGNYLASFILNKHRTDKWYVGWEQYPKDGSTAYTEPTWYLLAHSGNISTGDNSGEIKIAGINVKVKDIGGAAYKAANYYALASHGTHVTTETVKSALGATANPTAKKFLKDTGSWVQVAYTDLTGVPTSFTPAEHNHHTDHTLMHGYTRANIGTSPNYDNPQYDSKKINGIYEIRASSEVSGETGTRPATGFYPMLSLQTENVMMQFGGINSQGWFIRGKQAANVTLADVDWQKLITDANYKSYAWARPSSITADQILVSSGTAGETTLRGIYTLSAKGDSGWSTAANRTKIPDMGFIAYWNGAYSGTSSNLSVLGTVTTGTWQASVIGASYIDTAIARLDSPTFTGTPKAPTAANGTSTTQIATTEFVNNTLAYANAMTFKGTLGTGGTVTELPASHNAGDTYRVIKAGTYAGKYCEVGTLIICIKDGTAAADADWTSVETNEDGAVIGPTSSTENSLAFFNSTSGRVLDDTGTYVKYLNHATTIINDKTFYQDGLLIAGVGKGAAGDLNSGVAGVISWGDPGPQIQFDSSGQKGSIIFTEYNTAGLEASWHFVTNQSNGANVTSTGFTAKKYMTVGQNTIATSYNLYNAGTQYQAGILTANNIIQFNRTGYGIYLKDGAGTSYAGIYDNGSNLWVGATSSSGNHHKGSTYISAGYASDGVTGNKCAYISIPTKTNDTVSHTVRRIATTPANNNSVGSNTKPVYADENGYLTAGLPVFVQNSTTITNTTDWDTLMTAGCYKVQMSAWGDAETYHSPNQAQNDLYSFGLLFVLRGNEADTEKRTLQIYFPHRTDNAHPIYCRMANGATPTWQSWHRLTRGNFDTSVLTSGTLPWSRGGTGTTEHTQNRLVWSQSASVIQAGYHYANTTKIAVNSTTEPTTNFYVNGSSEVSGNSSTDTLTISSENLTSHIQFSRKNWNYITYPDHANSALAIGYNTGDSAVQQLVIQKSGLVRPGGNNTQNLGDSNHKWNTVYATTFNGNATTATKANLLAASTAENTTGLQYYSGQPTIGSADGNAYEGSSNNYKLWSYPADYTAHTTVANIQTIRAYWSSAYFHDIFMSPNNENLLHRSVLNNSAKNWRVILDSANYTSYTVTKTGTGASGTWDISISGTATTATNLDAAPTITKEGTATINLAAATAYTLTVGGKTVVFKTPADSNTHSTTKLIAGGSSATANAAVSSGNVYLRLFDDSTHRSNIQLKAGTAMAITSDANGVITFTSSDTNNAATHTLAKTTKYYVTGTTSATTSTSGDSFDTGVYVTAVEGELSAVRHSYNVGGTEKAYTYYNTSDDSIDFVFVA